MLTVITAAGTDDRVAGLVYIAALAPDDGETSQSLEDHFPTTEILSHIEVADGRVWMLPDGVPYFASDLSDFGIRTIVGEPGESSSPEFTSLESYSRVSCSIPDLALKIRGHLAC